MEFVVGRAFLWKRRTSMLYQSHTNQNMLPMNWNTFLSYNRRRCVFDATILHMVNADINKMPKIYHIFPFHLFASIRLADDYRATDIRVLLCRIAAIHKCGTRHIRQQEWKRNWMGNFRGKQTSRKAKLTIGISQANSERNCMEKAFHWHFFRSQ